MVDLLDIHILILVLWPNLIVCFFGDFFLFFFFFSGAQVGGWTQVYENLTFVTVRDAGHEVPQYQPGRALQLFKYFLKGQSLPGFDYPN
jgi:hypothetical protein